MVRSELPDDPHGNPSDDERDKNRPKQMPDQCRRRVEVTQRRTEYELKEDTDGPEEAKPLKETGVFPGLALQLIRVGEETGQLDQMLLRIAVIYDGEVKRTIERMLSLLVPLVTLVLGVLIAAIIGSMMAAILSSYDLAF